MSGQSQFGLLRQRRFGPFFATQFLGALNDNVLKNALVIAFTYQATAWSTLSASSLSNLAQALFILPFFLFSIYLSICLILSLSFCLTPLLSFHPISLYQSISKTQAGKPEP